MRPSPRPVTARLRTVAAGIVAALLTTLALAVGSVPAAADELDDQRAQTEARQAAVDAALEALAAELEHTDAALVQAYAELQGIQAQIPVAAEQLATAEGLLAQLQREAAIIADRLAAAQAEEATIAGQIATDTARADVTRAAIGQMARDAYKGDMASSSLSAVLDAGSTDEFVEQSALASMALRTQTQALRDLDQILGVNRNREVRLAAVREQITALKAEADAKVAQAAEAAAQAAARKAELDALEAEARDKAAVIEAQKQSQLALEAELEAQEAALAADLAAIVAAQEAARRAAGQSPVGSTAAQPFTNPTSVNPIYKTSDYGNRFHPVLLYWRLHAGTDLRTYCGTPIYAGAAGTVQWAYYRAGYGNQVMVNHGYWNGSSLMSSYNHMSSFSVGQGQQVSQGQLLGYSGNTGTSAACHLHFEVYVNGATVDPWPLISR
ncbi:peptidoglycan DD-metalloendopeptidase family protein [Actinotalea sp.]|uniref:peptidoglycan DD-metalloendopeptidase family protein n=1 Tax=Actinotalea sp. TaxID=1872145 RepID=UPI002C425182|nr:peptidoglycan DD-metalloendopeptidase family protein [Actinotalea sp.]HRA49447.1 peptidoglycan DD-metalloendopeptidase family protein [Actinotalea sp.]